MPDREASLNLIYRDVGVALGKCIPPWSSLLEPGLVLFHHHFALNSRRKGRLGRLSTRAGPVTFGCHCRDYLGTTQRLLGLRQDAGSRFQGTEPLLHLFCYQSFSRVFLGLGSPDILADLLGGLRRIRLGSHDKLASKSSLASRPSRHPT